VGVELALIHYLPEYFNFGLWTSRVQKGTDPQMVLYGYFLVSFWNLVITFAVLWLFSRSYVKFLGAFRVPHKKQNRWIQRFRSKILTLHESHSVRTLVPHDKKSDGFQHKEIADGPASLSNSKQENSDDTQLIQNGPASRSNSKQDNSDDIQLIQDGSASPVSLASDSNSKQENSDGVPTPQDGPASRSKSVSQDENPDVPLIKQNGPTSRTKEKDTLNFTSHDDEIGALIAQCGSQRDISKVVPKDENSDNVEAPVYEMDAALKLFYEAKMRLNVFQEKFFHKQAFYTYFWTFVVIYLVALNVTYFQWRFYMDSSCGHDRHNFTHVRAFSSPTKVITPVELLEIDENGTKICPQYYVDNTTTTNSSQTLEPFFSNQCTEYHTAGQIVYT